MALSGLRERLGEMQSYLEQVLEGKLPVNNHIIYNMQVSKWVGGWVGWIEGEQAVRTRYCRLWVGG